MRRCDKYLHDKGYRLECDLICIPYEITGGIFIESITTAVALYKGRPCLLYRTVTNVIDITECHFADETFTILTDDEIFDWKYRDGNDIAQLLVVWG